ncbi:MAG TPA: VOC family protein [Pirellulaceae bacterium]|nr:VOC family protein [Pirellulaceae bacterium]
MSNIVDHIGQLAERLRTVATDAEVEFTSYPSGSAMLDVRRQGRLYVMSFSPQQGFGVDEVRDGEGFQNTYQFAFSDFQPAAQKLWELATASAHCPNIQQLSTAPVELSLIVVYADDIARSKRFYEALGLTFSLEDHGGPEHYACRIGSAILEIYPRKGTGSQSPPFRLGFRVPSVDRSVEILAREGSVVVTPAQDSPWGRRAVVKDPDGHSVEINSQQQA